MTRKPGVKFNKVHHGVFARRSGEPRLPESLRFSTYLRALKKQGTPAEAIAEFESDKAKFGSNCPVHGEMEDPVIALHGEGAERRVAFCCPWCSGPEVLAAWEKEGQRS